MDRWQEVKAAANRGDYNLQFIILFFSLPGLLLLLAEWLGWSK